MSDPNGTNTIEDKRQLHPGTTSTCLQYTQHTIPVWQAALGWMAQIQIQNPNPHCHPHPNPNQNQNHSQNRNQENDNENDNDKDQNQNQNQNQNRNQNHNQIQDQIQDQDPKRWSLKPEGKMLKQHAWGLLRTYKVMEVYQALGHEIPYKTLQAWKRKIKQNEPMERAVKIHVTYAQETKEKMITLLKTHTAIQAYKLCERRIPFGTLRHWRRKALSGAPLKRPSKALMFPALEEKVFAWFKARRTKQLPVFHKDLRQIATQFARELNITDKYIGGHRWATSFTSRFRITRKARNVKSCRTTPFMTELLTQFFNLFNETIALHRPSVIWNYDEVGLTFEPNISHTLHLKGEKNVGILSLQAQHLRMTVILLISSTGTMTPPVLLYYNKGFTPFTLMEYPETLIISNSRGYNTEDTNYNMVLPHLLKHIKEGSLLIHDECKAHSSTRIDTLLSTRGILSLRLPGGTTCLLQPVDRNIGRLLKLSVKNQFMKWCFENFDTITAPEGRRRKSFLKPTNKLMASWIMEGIKGIKSEYIINSFDSAGLLSQERQQIILKCILPKYFVNQGIKQESTHDVHNSNAVPCTDDVPNSARNKDYMTTGKNPPRPLKDKSISRSKRQQQRRVNCETLLMPDEGALIDPALAIVAPNVTTQTRLPQEATAYTGICIGVASERASDPTQVLEREVNELIADSQSLFHGVMEE